MQEERIIEAKVKALLETYGVTILGYHQLGYRFAGTVNELTPLQRRVISGLIAELTKRRE